MYLALNLFAGALFVFYFGFEVLWGAHSLDRRRNTSRDRTLGLSTCWYCLRLPIWSVGGCLTGRVECCLLVEIGKRGVVVVVAAARIQWKRGHSCTSKWVATLKPFSVVS
ncbi:uncharacterized protein TM35_000231220 [Trypanosoma theileri]|uniref:Uncharacterized protein n=1 Tax=Trypanosoma theileri TaxID=67003 RepID=A0A1X0NRD2_9TRYP|nr:uncharacterized protein TM35_000231220 [Trypanosoma theileri]ORC87151.1 hypothetical protein TM35_000231220 [Trypanosoma theileri]